MANLNLSEFTEKLFVANADHTFIWDSAASISKRVSRNSWLNSGTLTSDAPVTISQTWNDLPTVFTALKVNATSTNSALASKLLDLQLGGASKAYVDKNGAIYGTGVVSGVTFKTWVNASQVYNVDLVGVGLIFAGYPGQFFLPASSFMGWNSNDVGSGSVDTKLFRDSASGNTLALRNGAAAQTFNVYGTYTSASVYERMFLRYNGTDLAFQVGAETLGATARPLQLWTGGASRLHVTTAGNVGIGTTAPGAKLHVVGNGLFGINSTSGTATPVRVSFGGTYGTSTPGSKGNLKWDLYNDGSFEINTYGIGMSLGLMEFQTGLAGGFGFYPNASTTSALHIIPSGNVGIGTTSPTSKLHVVGDAVLTGQLLGGDYTVGTLTASPQPCVSFTNNHAAFANSSIVISTKGTGAFILGPKPDGLAAGGNVRGIYSVDLQIARTVANQVASGSLSTITGGYQNKATGDYTFVGGGVANTASGSASVVSGGSSCTASGAQSAAAGLRNQATSDYSFIAGGSDALANRVGLSAHASGLFVVPGDAQTTKAVFRNKTTTNTAVELFLDGSSARYTITSGKIISMLINITGTKSDGSAVAHYVRQYSIKNIGGTTSEVYAAVTVGTDNAAGTSIALSANDTNEALKIEVTGVASETWRWVASVDAVEVGHGV